MKLYLLTPIKDWLPWYDKCFGVVVRAKTVEQARELASESAGDEGKEVWFDATLTRCEELTNEGEPGRILVNFASA